MERRCGCSDVCPISIFRTPDNPGRKFRGCHNYKDPDGGCSYFKWLDEEDFIPSKDQFYQVEQRDTYKGNFDFVMDIAMVIHICKDTTMACQDIFLSNR
ncbi:hypothetical protein LXL04_008522 [Taraxacum kok-saghyz]